MDGNRVRTSLTLSDCTCGKNTGYDLSRYRNYQDIFNHLHDLNLGDTASLLRKVRSDNNIIPSMSRGHASADNRKQVLLYMFDENDVITADAISEAKKLKLAGVSVYAVMLDSNLDVRQVRKLVSSPDNQHVLVVSNDKASVDAFVDNLYNRLCKARV